MSRAAVAVVLSLTLSGVARAQDDDSKKAAVLEEARQHVAKAKVHYDLGEFKEAADEYIIVYRLRPIPALLFNIAQAYRQGGLYDKARQFYKSYLRESPEAKNRATIELSIREMDELLAKEKRTKEAAPLPPPRRRRRSARTRSSEPRRPPSRCKTVSSTPSSSPPRRERASPSRSTRSRADARSRAGRNR